MKIKHLFIALAALTLFSCGGGNQNNTQNTDTSSNGDGVHTVSTNPNDELSRITCEVLKYGKKNWKEEDRMGTYQLNEEDLIVDNITDYPQYSLDSPDPESSRVDSTRFYAILDGGFDDLWSCSFRKRKSGGYWIWIELESRSGDCPDCTSSHYKAVTYIDGVIKEDLPRPYLSEFYANSDDFPKDALLYLENHYRRHYTYDFEENSIKVSFSLCQQFFETDEYGEDVLKEVLPRSFVGLEKKKGDMFPSVTYVWNGDGFEISPNHKPYKEDLKYFKQSGEKFGHSSKYLIELYAAADDDQYSYADLNHDNIIDLVISDNEEKEFAVYFKDDFEVYNRQLVGHRPEKDADDPDCSLYAYAKDDTLFVCASYESSKDYVFYYKKDAFYLLKYSQSMSWPDDGGSDYEEIDFVNLKFIDNDKTTDIPPYPLRKLEDVPLGWWTITSIYSGCNMLDIWKQLDSKSYDSDAEKENCLKFERNFLTYTYDDEHCTRTRCAACFQRDQQKDTIVFDTYYSMCESQSGIFINHQNEMIQYVCKNGKLTQIELQEDLKPYTTEEYQSNISINDDSYGTFNLIIWKFDSNESILFTWNGEQFVKEKE